MKKIDDSRLSEFGVKTNHEVMDNGEKRFRLIGSDGSSYIRTEASSDSGWQNSHYHTVIKELYLVQSGSIIFVQLIDGRLDIKKYSEGEFCISEPMVPHNCYMFPNAITHTIKFGDCSTSDWIASLELDEMIKNIDVEDL